MKKTFLPILAAGLLGFTGCLSSASSFVASSVPIEQGKYTQLATESTATCLQVQWLFLTFGKAGSPQRHALEDAVGQISGAEALVSMAVDTEQFALISTSLMPFPILPVFTETRVTGTPVKLSIR